MATRHQVLERVVEQQERAVRTATRPTPASEQTRIMQSTSSRLTHLVCRHAGPVGRDDPARVAVVDGQRLARRAPAPAGSRSSSAKFARQRGLAGTARVLQRRHRDVAAGRRLDQVEQVAHAGRRSTSRWRSSPRRRRSAASSVVCGIAAQLVAASAPPRGRRTPRVQPVRRVRWPAVTPAAAGGLVDRDAAGTVAGADGEHRDVAQQRHGAAGGGEHRDRRPPARSCAAARAATARPARSAPGRS